MSQYYQPLYSAQQFQYSPYQHLQSGQVQYPSQYENNKWNLQESNLEYGDDTEDCSCDDCENLKPSCRSVCTNCYASPPPILGPIASNYLFVPFPYPYQITTKTPLNTSQASTTEKLDVTQSPAQTTSTKQTTTVEKITKSSVPSTLTTEPPIHTSEVNIETTEISVPRFLEMKNKSPYMPTPLRRTKPNWIPKYGIVPISDQFAEKIMFQMRSMKVLHPRRNNLRIVDNITL